MNIFIDLILIAILVVSSFFAAKKGLIGTIFSLLSTLVAIILAVVISTPVSNFVDSQFVNPSVKKYILTAVDNSSIGKSYDDAINSIDVVSKIKEMPDQLEGILNMAGVNVDEIVNKAENTKNNAAEAKDNLIDSIARPISSAISRVISLVILFVIFNIALWVVAKLITAVFNALPLGKSLNKFGGLAFGLIRGLLIVFVISTLFAAVSKTIKPDSNNIFSKKTIDSSIVLKTAIDINPLGSVLKIK